MVLILELTVMRDKKPDSVEHSVKREPKFCKCRLCHEYFYANTIDKARQACQEHAAEFHPDWGVTACYCPDY